MTQANPDYHREVVYTQGSTVAETPVRQAPVHAPGGKEMLHVLQLPQLFEEKAIYELLKRLMDIAFSVLGLILLLPIMVAIGLIIKIETPGPVFFKQVRVGKNRRRSNGKNGFPERRVNHSMKGKPFLMYKFRTMSISADPYGVSPKNSDDQRITRSGKIMRKLCIDEIPQLINVLKGDMSLVGPRPEMPFIVEKYTPAQSMRLLVKPGLTGPWQLYGSRSEAIHQNIHYDMEYIRNRSLLLDVKILFKTALFVLDSSNI